MMTGAPLAELKTLAVERVAHGDPWDERQYEMYPPALKSPYRERRSAFGRERYSALGIAREDLEARQRAAIGNWKCFGAPAALRHAKQVEALRKWILRTFQIGSTRSSIGVKFCRAFQNSPLRRSEFAIDTYLILTQRSLKTG